MEGCELLACFLFSAREGKGGMEGLVRQVPELRRKLKSCIIPLIESLLSPLRPRFISISYDRGDVGYFMRRTACLPIYRLYPMNR